MASIADAVDHLRAGGVVAFPTETVYGLGARALVAADVRRVFALKGRPASNPLIVHVADDAMARALAAEWSAAAARLAARYWPGPLTLVVPKAGRVPAEVTAGAPTVALRCPDHPIALALLRALGEPLVGPSANRSGAVSPTTAEHVRATFNPSEVLVLDGGPCRIGIESTVLALDGAHPLAPIVLRPGAVGADELAEVLGQPVRAAPPDGSAHGSPGRLGPHYQPRARVIVVDEGTPFSADPGDIVLSARPNPVVSTAPWIEMPADAAGFAARLYAALREADQRGAARIVVLLPTNPRESAGIDESVANVGGSGTGGPSAGRATVSPRAPALWHAIRERLARAQAPR